MSLFINEIFASLQGEGFWTGTPCTFIRFAGCNLNCSWCDTKYAQNRRDAQEIAPRKLAGDVLAMGNKMIVLTGGEPTIQDGASMLELCLDLKSTGAHAVHMETNGVLVPNWVECLDWVTVSPKQNTDWHMTHANEVKVVYNDHTEKELEDMEILAVQKGTMLYLQPKDNDNDQIAKCVDIVKRRKAWRLGLQLHRITKIR